ncbi:hypothetical protein HPB50_000037 [Hyalomma asiaticum]|uniref:Uncharacterized protein n=1 Tax=Hyalomma asiaticum TaxID=266040 RepID=A0ACB7SAY7_HYAAI|nr:hypothetical protein HPB50_000037 [Hyalomma asiaticum]
MLVGSIYVSVLGRYVIWSNLAFACLLPPALLMPLSWFLVESPRWLLQTGHRERAMEMQRSLRKEPVEANAEFKMMARAFSRATTPSLHYWLAAHIMFLQQFCGANVAATYAREIVAAAGVDAHKDDADLVMLVIQVAVTCAALPLMDTVGRLRLLLVSANICVVSMILLGGVYPDMPAGITSSTMSTAANVTEVAVGSSGARGSRFALGFLAIFFFGYGLGIGPLTWIQAVELTPLRGHGVEFGSVCTFHWACAFCSATFFERVRDMLGRRRSFKVGAACRCKRPTAPTVDAGLGISLPPLGLQMKSDSMSNDVPSPFKCDHSAGLSQERVPSTHIY